jgi:hypothetical protein
LGGGDWGIAEVTSKQVRGNLIKQTVTRLVVIFILSLTPFWMSTVCNHRRWRP